MPLKTHQDLEQGYLKDGWLPNQLRWLQGFHRGLICGGLSCGTLSPRKLTWALGSLPTQLFYDSLQADLEASLKRKAEFCRKKEPQGLASFNRTTFLRFLYVGEGNVCAAVSLFSATLEPEDCVLLSKQPLLPLPSHTRTSLFMYINPFIENRLMVWFKRLC